jgi:hypothetical protein
VSDEQQWQIAGEIEQSNRAWLVIWGRYSRLFWAFPRFKAPAGTILSASNPDQLLAYMDSVQLEQSAASREPAYAAPTAASALPWTSQAMPQPTSRGYEPYVPDLNNHDAELNDPEPHEADRGDPGNYDYDEDPYDFYRSEEDDPSLCLLAGLAPDGPVGKAGSGREKEPSVHLHDDLANLIGAQLPDCSAGEAVECGGYC